MRRWVGRAGHRAAVRRLSRQRPLRSRVAERDRSRSPQPAGRLIVFRVGDPRPTGLLTAWPTGISCRCGASLAPARHRAHGRHAGSPQGDLGPFGYWRRPGRWFIPGDSADLELHGSRGRACIDLRDAVGRRDRRDHAAGGGARARRHRQVGARPRIRLPASRILCRRVVAERCAARGRFPRASRGSTRALVELGVSSSAASTGPGSGEGGAADAGVARRRGFREAMASGLRQRRRCPGPARVVAEGRRPGPVDDSPQWLAEHGQRDRNRCVADGGCGQLSP